VSVGTTDEMAAFRKALLETMESQQVVDNTQADVTKDPA
jgi:hypothetical protein